MKRISFLCLFLVGALSTLAQKDQQKYPDIVGDISYQPDIDGKNFRLCDSTSMGQNLGWDIYKGEKISIDKAFESQYKFPLIKGESGYIRIRFIVNCKGETGRFRIISSDENYINKTFEKKIRPTFRYHQKPQGLEYIHV